VLIIFQHWFDLRRSGADPEETGRGGNRGESHYFQGPFLRKNRIFGWGEKFSGGLARRVL
jgi:hypothetical protein